jgi:hypothetical protein
MDKYIPVIGPLPKTGVKAVDAIVKDNDSMNLNNIGHGVIFKDNGSMNLNNIGYPEVSRLYTRDFIRLVKLSPKTIAEQVSIGWLDYFRPAPAWASYFDPANQSSVEAVDRWYRFFFCIGVENALGSSVPANNHYSEKQIMISRLSSVNWEIVPIYAVFALFLVYMPFQRWTASEDTSRRQLLLFLISNIAYSAVLCNIMEVGENMRYRYETQGLVVIAGTIICYQILMSSFNVVNRVRTRLQ